MRMLKRLAGFLGLARDEPKDPEEDEDQQPKPENHRFNFQETGLPRRGFSVPVQVSVDRPVLPPLLSSCSDSDGGVQGLRWYTKHLRIDQDGDVADEFFDEVVPETSSSVDEPNKPFPKFRVNYRTGPAKITKQVMSEDGKIQQCVEHQGKLLWA